MSLQYLTRGPDKGKLLLIGSGPDQGKLAKECCCHRPPCTGYDYAWCNCYFARCCCYPDCSNQQNWESNPCAGQSFALASLLDGCFNAHCFQAPSSDPNIRLGDDYVVRFYLAWDATLIHEDGSTSLRGGCFWLDTLDSCAGLSFPCPPFAGGEGLPSDLCGGAGGWATLSDFQDASGQWWWCVDDGSVYVSGLTGHRCSSLVPGSGTNWYLGFRVVCR